MKPGHQVTGSRFGHALLALALAACAGCAPSEGTVLKKRPVQPGGDGDGDATPDGSVMVGPDGQVVMPPAGDSGIIEQPGVGGCRITQNQGFVESFTGDTLDATRWLVAHGNRTVLGERSAGGFSRDNVRLENNKLVLTVRGDLYTGPVRGFDSDGSQRSDGVRTGAAIATRDLYMSGTYQWEGRFLSEPGVKLSIAILRAPADDGALAIVAPGLDGTTRSYSFIEAVLDTGTVATPLDRQIELPDPLASDHPQSLRIDWHAGGPGIARPFVDYWYEGDSVLKVEDPQPSRAGRLWLLAFVPPGSAANFDTAEILIETAFITTFGEGNDTCSDAELAPGMLVAP